MISERDATRFCPRHDSRDTSYPVNFQTVCFVPEVEMPKVKSSRFACPQCGQPMRVSRTSASAARLIRTRLCPAGHRVTTSEVAVGEPHPSERAIGSARIQIALAHLAKELGITLDSNCQSGDKPDN